MTDVSYKIYIGEYRDKLPPLTYIMSCKRCELRQIVKHLNTMLNYGMDVYVKSANGRITAIHNKKEKIYGKM